MVDTSAFYALEDASDAHHGQAVALRDGLKDPRFRLFTTNLVLAESITLLTYRLGAEHAVRFADLAYSSERLQVIRMTEDLERAAVERLRRTRDDELSFVDASLIECVERWDIDRIFAFDRDFVRHGRRLLAPADIAGGRRERKRRNRG